MWLRSNGLILAWITLWNPSLLHGQQPALSCDKVSRARPGSGVAYKGTVRNSDYRFSATIPDGSVGWGSAQSAPFHGFAIYPADGSEATGCIVFIINIHVDLPEDAEVGEQRSTHAKPVPVGNRVGLQTSTIGSVKGTSFENVTVTLELPRNGYKNDVAITLITPISEEKNAKAAFARFLASFRFW